ncbi:MAG: peroxidase-related enzyme [Hyphomicrobium sp.]|nr:peroxidase-related enzyme [Hyphomicrobium sp.]
MVYKIKDLALLTIETTTGKAKALLENAKQKFGFVPNMYGAMAHEPALFEAYANGYIAFRAECGFTPSEQEVIFLAISRYNGCDYCMAAHSFIADMMSKVPVDVTDAIRDGRPIDDARLAALAQFTSKMVDSRGRPEETDVAAFKAAGFTEKNILGVILAISVKTLSNYTNHVFDTPLDATFSSRAWKAAARG